MSEFLFESFKFSIHFSSHDSDNIINAALMNSFRLLQINFPLQADKLNNWRWNVSILLSR
jgi:hypothetical protein